jgi:hypothetical protein
MDESWGEKWSNESLERLYREMTEQAMRDMLSRGSGGGGMHQSYDPPQEEKMPFGDPNFRPYDPKSPGIDKPYWGLPDDSKFYLRVLLESGYRPYLLRRQDNGETQTVWSRSSDLSRYAAGEVVPLKMGKGLVVSELTRIILVDEADGGIPNEHGRQKVRKR